MLSEELKAQAKLAWHNWRTQNPGSAGLMTEDYFIEQIQNLQGQFNKGLLQRNEFDNQVSELLKQPGIALSVTQLQAPQKSTEALLAELEDLKKRGILKDEEFENRKAELYFQRNVEMPNENAPEMQGNPDKMKFLGYLDELKAAGILLQREYEEITARM